jgi:phospholipid transport system substrate-binding protein
MTNMLRRLFLIAALALIVAPALSVTPARAEADDARKFVEGLAEHAIATVADRQLTEQARDDRFRNLFISSFDIPGIGQFVLGRYWKLATPDQQQEFLKLFEEMNVLTWAKRFKDYQGETLKTLGANKEGERGWLVDSQIVRPQGPPIPVQWDLRENGDGFRVVDIIVEGVRMGVTYRSDYSSAMQANGGKFDALLATMRTKLDQLRAAG